MTKAEKAHVDQALRVCAAAKGPLQPEQIPFVQKAIDLIDRDIQETNPKLYAAMLESRAKGF